ncbi:hypothetical protein HDV00_007853 [Rhizophlyctis rosea]|nr:hypothetical protein HDV00_007853 [Rhizophlyctis rosea]
MSDITSSPTRTTGDTYAFGLSNSSLILHKGDGIFKLDLTQSPKIWTRLNVTAPSFAPQVDGQSVVVGDQGLLYESSYEGGLNVIDVTGLEPGTQWSNIWMPNMTFPDQSVAYPGIMDRGTMFYFNNAIYILGGWNPLCNGCDESFSNMTLVYNTQTGVASTFFYPFNVNRNNQVAVVGNTAYSTGGFGYSRLADTKARWPSTDGGHDQTFTFALTAGAQQWNFLDQPAVYQTRERACVLPMGTSSLLLVMGCHQNYPNPPPTSCLQTAYTLSLTSTSPGWQLHNITNNQPAVMSSISADVTQIKCASNGNIVYIWTGSDVVSLDTNNWTYNTGVVLPGASDGTTPGGGNSTTSPNTNGGSGNSAAAGGLSGGALGGIIVAAIVLVILAAVGIIFVKRRNAGVVSQKVKDLDEEGRLPAPSIPLVVGRRETKEVPEYHHRQ